LLGKQWRVVPSWDGVAMGSMAVSARDDCAAEACRSPDETRCQLDRAAPAAALVAAWTIDAISAIGDDRC
jgi:hypothetical protein